MPNTLVDDAVETMAQAGARIEHLVGRVDALTKERDELVELLADIREFLDGQQDADYEPGVSGPHPNKAMQFCTRIDELIGEYS